MKPQSHFCVSLTSGDQLSAYAGHNWVTTFATGLPSCYIFHNNAKRCCNSIELSTNRETVVYSILRPGVNSCPHLYAHLELKRYGWSTLSKDFSLTNVKSELKGGAT